MLPPPGAQRNRQLVLLGVVLVALVWVFRSYVVPELGNGETTTTPVRASNPQARPAPGTPAPASFLPEAMKLDALEPVPDEPSVGRNPFAFGVRPAPPVPVAPPVPIGQTPPPPPKPEWPPPIALRLVTIVELPDGRRQANLKDPANGSTFIAVEGSIVDGRYKVVKVAQQSVVVSYLDGSGQRTLTLGG
jgi:hypothetical protein